MLELTAGESTTALLRSLGSQDEYSNCSRRTCVQPVPGNVHHPSFHCTVGGFCAKRSTT